jgi:alpha-L-fucosidase
MIRNIHIACMPALLSLGTIAQNAQPPEPVYPVPSERQLAWHELEYYGFFHFTQNTFTDKEWGYGDEKPEDFRPAACDPRQWVEVAKEAGMKAVIPTCKHHDGFCLWPSKYTEHSVKNSPYRDGKGDIVGEVAQACRELGLKFGIYLSPWDRNHPEYGRPEYVEYFRNQLRELLTEYGEISEVWFDGANGGDGYYGGAREERRIDRTTYYGWETTWAMVRELQPNAIIFSDVGPDIRWVGNESGYAGDPCWHTYTPHSNEPGKDPAPGVVKYREGVNGHADGKYWLPAEVDVSIRPGWFYHESQNDEVRSPENLMELYYQSVGRGASLLLNVPPDDRGLVHENDIAALMGFKALRDAAFRTDLARGAKAAADNVRGNTAAWAAANVLDGNRKTCWATDDGVTEASLTLATDAPVTFNHVVLREYIELGQRILKFSVEAQVEDEWKTIAEGTSIGWKRILRTGAVTTDQVRVNILEAKACPMLSAVSLYAGPPRISIAPDAAGFVDRQEVAINCQPANARIYYTTDGSAPSETHGLRYEGPFAIDETAEIRVIAFVGETPCMKEVRRRFRKLGENDFMAPVTPAKTGRGVDFACYEGGWQSLSDMKNAEPVRRGRASSFDVKYRSRDEHFALRFTGYIDIPETGVWRFSTASDDGSNLYIGDVQVVANDYLQAPTERSGSIPLRKGLHPIRVDYFNAAGNMALTVNWIRPDGAAGEIPPGALFREKS